MSPELIGILTVGVALAALVLTSTGRLRGEIQSVRSELGSEIAAVRSELGSEIAAVRKELGSAIAALDARIGALEQRMARLEGLLEGAGLYRPATEATQPAAGD